MGCVVAPDRKTLKNYLPPKRYNNFKDKGNFTFFNLCQRHFSFEKIFSVKKYDKSEIKALMALNIGSMKNLKEMDPNYVSWFFWGSAFFPFSLSTTV